MVCMHQGARTSKYRGSGVEGKETRASLEITHHKLKHRDSGMHLFRGSAARPNDLHILFLQGVLAINIVVRGVVEGLR